MLLLVLAGLIAQADYPLFSRGPVRLDYYGALMAVILAVGTLLGLAVWSSRARARGSRLPTVLGFVALEEALSIGLLMGPYPEPLAGLRLVLLVAGAAVGAVLLLRLPLPENLFPVRGRWLRSLLAAGVLAGLAQAGPWWYFFQKLWSMPGMAPALLLGIAFGLWSAFLAGRVLLVGFPRPRLTRSARKQPASGAA